MAISHQIKVLQLEIDITKENYDLEVVVLNKMRDLELYEESLRKNKARDLLIKCGDKNTRHFQNKTKSR